MQLRGRLLLVSEILGVVFLCGRRGKSTGCPQRSSLPPQGLTFWVWLPASAVRSCFLCKRFYPQDPECGGAGPGSALETEEWGRLGVTAPVLSTKAWGPAPISPPGLAWPLGGLADRRLHTLLPPQPFPPTHRALTGSRALPGGAFPSPAEGPLGLQARAHPFPVLPQLLPNWKVSLKLGGFLLPSPLARKGQSE